MSPRIILSYIWVLLATMSGCFYGAWRNKRACEEYLPITFFGISFVLYLGGILKQLTLTVHLLMLATLILSVVLVVWMVCRDGVGSLKRLFTPAMVLYVLASGFFVVTQWRLVSAVPDEASHWMDVIRAMQYTDTFGLAAEGRSYYGTYPPAVSLIEFFGVTTGTILTARIIDPLAYLMMHLTTLSLFMPFLSRMKTSGWVKVVLGACAFFTLPLICYSQYFANMMVDGLLALLAGFCILYPLLGLEGKLPKATYLLGLFVLCLAKSNGIAFALMSVLLYGISCRKNGLQEATTQKRQWILVLSAAMVVLGSWVSWKVLTAIHQPLFSQPWKEPFSFAQVKERLYVFYIIFDYFFSETLEIGFVKIPGIAVLILLLVAVYLLLKRNEIPSLRQNYKPLAIGLAVVSLLYLLGVCASYLTVFDNWEAERVSSIQRYSLVIWLMLGFIVVMLAFLQMNTVEPERKRRVCIVVLALAVLLFPYLKVNRLFLNGGTVANAHACRDRYDLMAYYVDRAIPEEEADIFLVSQKIGDREAFWFLHSLLRPHKVDNHNFNLALEGELDENGIPCVTRASYEEDMAAAISPQRWQEMLRDGYDYVLLYNLSDTFAVDYASAFEDPATIAQDSLYQVLEDGTLRHLFTR